jgi:hypothetical protein
VEFMLIGGGSPRIAAISNVVTAHFRTRSY